MAIEIVSAIDAGRTCPYCRFPLKKGASAVRCSDCDALHHEDCWSDGEGCATFGCGQSAAIKRNAQAGISSLSLPPVKRQPVLEVKDSDPTVAGSSASAPLPKVRNDSGQPSKSLVALLSGLAAILLIALAVGLLTPSLRGDGGGATTGDVAVDPAEPGGEAESTDAESADSSDVLLPEVIGDSGEEPSIADSDGSPPATLMTEDEIFGDGAEAQSGDEVTVNYVGHNWSNNAEFDTSWGKEPFTFTLGSGSVIEGWEQGVEGMREGGRRLLVIPPELGYGSEGQGSIPANETLIFVVDLESVNR